MIVKSGSGYILYNHTGVKVLGRFKTLAEAKNRERQINYFKSIK